VLAHLVANQPRASARRQAQGCAKGGTTEAHERQRARP
jgi:hypothetical protein